MKTQNYSPFEKSIAKNACVLLFSFLLILQAQSQTVVSTESFPNSFNTGVTTPPPGSSFTGSIGTWAVTGDNDATISVNNHFSVSSPYALKVANFSNASHPVSTSIATAPVVNLASYASSSSVTLEFKLLNYVADATNSSFTFYFEFYNGTAWVSIWSQTAAQLYAAYGLNSWNTITLNVGAAYLNSTFKYRVRGVNLANTNKDSFIFIDDIKIKANSSLCNSAPAAIPNFSGTPSQTAGTFNSTYDVGDVFKYTNIVTSPYNINAEIKIEAISNAKIVMFDENTQGVASRFQPEISPDQLLTADREGYAQFTITFRKASDNTIVNLNNLRFRHFDIDGHPNGSGYFRESGWETGYSSLLLNLPSDLSDVGAFTDGGYNWRKVLGELVDHPGFTSDPDVYMTATYTSASVIRFRMGYKFIKGNGGNHAQETRLYAAEFGCFDVSNNITLPLKVLSFGGAYRNQKAMLNWSTENEVNVEKFEIQRSTDGSEYTTVGYSLPNGGTKKTDYAFPDDVSNVSANAFYYRLKMVDKDGGFKYSQVILLKRDSKIINGISVTPNPAVNGIATIRMNSGSNGSVEIRVVDMTGKVLLRQINVITEGNNSIALNNLSVLKSGIYTVQMINGGTVESSKLSILR